MHNLNKSIADLRLPNTINVDITEYIGKNLRDENPYSCSASVAYNLANAVWSSLQEHKSNPDIKSLIEIVESANVRDGGVPPFVLRNGPQDPIDSLLDPDNRTGYEYGSNPNDRQKTGFVAEWFSWGLVSMLNHDAVIHPSEHGGKNRFHLISPIPAADKELRNTGASTGGGKFPQHSDATVYHELGSATDLDGALNELHTDVSTVAKTLGIQEAKVYEQALCRKFVRVDMTVLAGVLNLSTMTHVGLPSILGQHLIDNGLSQAEIGTLSRMPVAHIAGPADGEISGFVGNISPPLYLSKSGEVIGSNINSAPGRMVYVGKSDSDRTLFGKFVELVRTSPVCEVLLQSGDCLFLPNAFYGGNANVTHVRSELTDAEYNIPIGNGKYGRRVHCRQYAESRNRSNKKSFLASV